jgi:hypothetical protein
MGSGRWSTKDWTDYSKKKAYSTEKTDDIFTSRSLVNELDPKDVKFRESVDSNDNPNSTAIIVALDVTGSMDRVLDSMARKGLNTLATEIYNRKPVSDPHIMCMGIGDVEMGDEAPLQITQFEADLRIAQQLEKIYLERHGGGNRYESYALAWYFAAKHTKIDCFTKRNKKGYLFTIGDEEPTPYLRAKDIKRVLGYQPQADLTMDEILTLTSRLWNPYHLMVAEGSHYSAYPDETTKKWTAALGQHAIHLSDHNKLAETIISIIQINEGAKHDDVIKSWDGTTAIVIDKAIKDLSKGSTNGKEAIVSL